MLVPLYYLQLVQILQKIVTNLSSDFCLQLTKGYNLKRLKYYHLVL